MDYPFLSSSFMLGGLELRNRTIMSPMSSGLGRTDGSVSPEQIAFYRERAEGGVGMIIVEFTGVSRRLGLAEINQLSLDSPANLPGHIALVDAIRSTGCRAALQLHAPGRHADRRTVDGLTAGPTAEFSKRDGTPTARALQSREIEALIESFGQSAELAVQAGYEAIEVHGAHGYLPMAFLSPLSNRRDDYWGGDFDRRLRFAEAVIRRIRQAIGPATPLLYRLSSSEHLAGGLTLQDMTAIVPRLVAAGVDCLDVSTGTLAGTLDMTIDPMSMPEGWRFADARAIRNAAGVPVIGIGPVRWPETAERALGDGDADLICLGRPLLADPQWPAKALTNRRAEIRPCTNCNWCFSRVLEHAPIACAERPRTGREMDSPVLSQSESGKAIVIGGGPGGMAAAIELDRLGFRAELHEASPRLGGGLISSSRPPLKDKLGWYLDYLIDAVGQGNIKVHLGSTPSASSIAATSPDLVVIATGATPLPQDFVSNRRHVLKAYDVLQDDSMPSLLPGPVIVYGGGETGCETAEFLTAAGHAVVLVTRSDRRDLARSAEVMYRKHLLGRMQSNPLISIIDNCSILEVRDGHVLVRNANGNLSEIAGGSVIVAQGRRSGSQLAETLQGKGMPVAVIGDAAKVGRIGDAVHAAHAAIKLFLGERHRQLHTK